MADGDAFHKRNGRIEPTVMCTCGGAYVGQTTENFDSVTLAFRNIILLANFNNGT